MRRGRVAASGSQKVKPRIKIGLLCRRVDPDGTLREVLGCATFRQFRWKAFPAIPRAIQRWSPKSWSTLAISLSRYWLTFDRMAVIRFVVPDPRYEDRSQSVGYAYPHSMVAGDYLRVIYSANEEDIEIARIPFSELETLK